MKKKFATALFDFLFEIDFREIFNVFTTFNFFEIYFSFQH